ncbi:MAG: DUF1499 domain-containing protein [Gemmatimonadota bacterium]|nr:DUF1499 domain-containing protein [Gemmatimonadota bacterium]
MRDGGPRRADVPRTVMDTRRDEGLEGRLYAVSFARVWDALGEVIGRRPGWTLVHADEDLGLLTARRRILLPALTSDVSVWVRLDEHGLTRVDVRAAGRARPAGPDRQRRAVHRLLAALDRALGPGARLRD